MALLELADTVFRRGCGFNLETALRSSAYQSLCREAHDLGLVEPDNSALVQFLGMQLAERAYQNVPAAIRAKVHTWHDGLAAQHKFLELICAELTGYKWKAGQGRAYAYNSDARCVLPAETGTFEHGDVQPNCLGTAQMLAGIAEEMDAVYFMANTLRANQDTLHTWKIRMLSATASTLQGRPGVEEFAATIEGARIKALEAANTHHQAHHILIVQTDDGAWWAVDPYLSALYKLPPSETRDANLLAVTRERNKLLTSTNPSPTIPEAIDYLDVRLAILGFMCMAIEARYFEGAAGSPLEILSYAAAYSISHEGAMGDPKKFQRRLPFLQTQALLKKDTELTRHALYTLIYATHDIEDFDELSARVEGATKETQAHMNACLERAGTDREYEQQLAVRLVRFVLKHMLAHTDELASRNDTRYHEGLEIGWAPMVLGIATLNHMQYEDAEHRPSLRGYLAVLLRSQWVIYDALVVAQQRGEPIDPERMDMFWGHLAKFEDMPELVIAPLVLLTQGRRTNG